MYQNTTPRRERKKQTGGDLFRIVSMIMDKHYDPVIVFSFSKKECEAYALALSKLDLITEEEKVQRCVRSLFLRPFIAA